MLYANIVKLWQSMIFFEINGKIDKLVFYKQNSKSFVKRKQYQFSDVTTDGYLITICGFGLLHTNR